MGNVVSASLLSAVASSRCALATVEGRTPRPPAYRKLAQRFGCLAAVDCTRPDVWTCIHRQNCSHMCLSRPQDPVCLQPPRCQQPLRASCISRAAHKKRSGPSLVLALTTGATTH